MIFTEALQQRDLRAEEADDHCGLTLQAIEFAAGQAVLIGD
jgi:hypothetical protein